MWMQRLTACSLSLSGILIIVWACVGNHLDYMVQNLIGSVDYGEGILSTKTGFKSWWVKLETGPPHSSDILLWYEFLPSLSWPLLLWSFQVPGALFVICQPWSWWKMRHSKGNAAPLLANEGVLERTKTGDRFADCLGCRKGHFLSSISRCW